MATGMPGLGGRVLKTDRGRASPVAMSQDHLGELVWRHYCVELVDPSPSPETASQDESMAFLARVEATGVGLFSNPDSTRRGHAKPAGQVRHMAQRN